jgi:hypothetical protein
MYIDKEVSLVWENRNSSLCDGEYGPWIRRFGSIVFHWLAHRTLSFSPVCISYPAFPRKLLFCLEDGGSRFLQKSINFRLQRVTHQETVFFVWIDRKEEVGLAVNFRTYIHEAWFEYSSRHLLPWLVARHCFTRFLQTDGGLVPRLAHVCSFQSFHSSNRQIYAVTDTDVVVKWTK